MDRRVIAAMRSMERGMGEDLPIEELAAAAGLSLHHFHRLFAEETGEPDGNDRPCARLPQPVGLHTGVRAAVRRRAGALPQDLSRSL